MICDIHFAASDGCTLIEIEHTSQGRSVSYDSLISLQIGISWPHNVRVKNGVPLMCAHRINTINMCQAMWFNKSRQATEIWVAVIARPGRVMYECAFDFRFDVDRLLAVSSDKSLRVVRHVRYIL